MLKRLLPYIRISFSHMSKRHSSTEERLVTINENNGVRKVIMNSPKTRNALSYKMLEELLEGIVGIRDQNLKCIVISSSGSVFSSGHNLKELAKEGAIFHHTTFSKCAELMLAINQCPLPVIAAVNGIAAAAGCQLVASCDIVIATLKSSFSTPGANVGIFCSNPSVPLSRSIGRKAAARMLFTGEPITAEEALRHGLVSKVCEENELENEVEKHVSAIKSKSRAVLALGKNFFYEQMDVDVESAYRWGSQLMTDNLKLADGREGLNSFVEKRAPVWKNDFTPAAEFTKEVKENSSETPQPKKAETTQAKA